VGSLIIIVAMFALLWVLMIRPQRAKQQQQRQLLESIDVGDEILTVGGLYGIVQEIDEDEDLVVEISENIHVRIARRAVAAVVKPDEEPDEEPDEDVVDAKALEETVGDGEPGGAEADAPVEAASTSAPGAATAAERS
jgi:preprotein translocase subunit YajC